ncbi:hypothetical protein D3C87_81640 [compost metagenome]
MISDEQQRLIDAIQAVHLACMLNGKSDLTINVIFNDLACNNKPGWNVLMNSARFEFGYEDSKVRCSIPPDEEECREFKRFLTEDLNLNKFEEVYRIGIKYLFEIEFDEFIYTDEGIDKISKLTDRILKYV